ncbi:MAG: PAS domain-containing sensor histidine kinase [Acidobacteriota bacterium]|nr:PAS domain-containing sensor histidine kinase [Acidobacteriota bacterium]
MENVEDYAVFVVDLDGNIVSWNPGVEKLLGYREDEIIGKKSAIIFTPEDIAAKAPEWELNTAFKEGRCEDVRWHIRKDGSRFWANGLMMLLKDESEQVRGFVKIMRDNSKHKEAEEERERLLESERAARAEAESATKAKDEFLAMVSHELRTPLNSIKGWSSILRQQPTEEMVEKVTEIIERQCVEQAQIIEDLLDTARIASGKLNLNIKNVDLVKVINSAVDTVRPLAENKNVSLFVTIESETALIKGDEERLLQVVLNLLSNAVKFTRKSGRIAVELRQEGSSFTIIIKDNGIGIKPEFLPYIFERYAQADSLTRQQSGGLGIGLSLVRDLVEMHGGTVHAESEGEGKGATFTIKFPAMLRHKS